MESVLKYLPDAHLQLQEVAYPPGSSAPACGPSEVAIFNQGGQHKP